MLQLLEQGRFDNHKTQAGSSPGIGPGQATFTFNHDLALGQEEADIEQS